MQRLPNKLSHSITADTGGQAKLKVDAPRGADAPVLVALSNPSLVPATVTFAQGSDQWDLAADNSPLYTDINSRCGGASVATVTVAPNGVRYAVLETVTTPFLRITSTGPVDLEVVATSKMELVPALLASKAPVP